MEGRPAGALGPRLAGRLTAELILRSPQYMNCIRYYEIDLRGNKVGAIENLGATENQFDCIDLSDNAIVRLEGFPKLNRLKIVLLNNNRIMRIGRQLEETVPNLEVLVLTNNRIAELKDIDPLGSLPRLYILSLIDNAVTKKPNYRLYTIHKLSKLKVLDFRKVKQKERDQARQLFGDVKANGVNTFEPDEELQQVTRQVDQEDQGNKRKAGSQQEEEVMVEEVQEADKAQASRVPTSEEIIAIKVAIANAQTLEEARRLEEALSMGILPSQLGAPSSEAQGGEAATAMDEG